MDPADPLFSPQAAFLAVAYGILVGRAKAKRRRRLRRSPRLLRIIGMMLTCALLYLIFTLAKAFA